MAVDPEVKARARAPLAKRLAEQGWLPGDPDYEAWQVKKRTLAARRNLLKAGFELHEATANRKSIIMPGDWDERKRALRK